MEAPCLLARCTNIAIMLIPLPTRVVRHSLMVKSTISPIATVGATKSKRGDQCVVVQSAAFGKVQVSR